VKITVRLALAAAVIALGVLLWGVLFPPAEKVIRGRLAELARTVSFHPNENPLTLAGKVESLTDMFATNVEVDVEVPNRGNQVIEGRDELMQAVAGARAATGSLTVEFIDVNVTVAADKQSATASLVVRARAAGEKDDVLQPLKFFLQKSGRDWLIRRVETLRTLT